MAAYYETLEEKMLSLAPLESKWHIECSEEIEGRKTLTARRHVLSPVSSLIEYPADIVAEIIESHRTEEYKCQQVERFKRRLEALA
jgi:hypothetical protein